MVASSSSAALLLVVLAVLVVGGARGAVDLGVMVDECACAVNELRWALGSFHAYMSSMVGLCDAADHIIHTRPCANASVSDWHFFSE